MRKVLRNIARANMRKAGMKQVDKRRYGINPSTGMPVRLPSTFAAQWPKYC